MYNLEMVLKIRRKIWMLKQASFTGISDLLYWKVTGRSIEQFYIDYMIHLRMKGGFSKKNLYKIIVQALTCGSMCRLSVNLRTICIGIAETVALIENGKYDESVRRKKKVESLIRSSSVSECRYSQWMKLQHIALSNGLFLIALEARKKAEKCVRKSKSAYSDMKLIGFYIESGRYGKAVELLERSSFSKAYKRIHTDYWEHLYQFCKYMANTGIENSNDGIKKDFSEVERGFYKYVKGKKIVILGPAYRDDYSPLMERYSDNDIMMLLSWGPDSQQHEILTRNAPDLSLYNGEATIQLKNSEKYKEFVKGLKYIILKAANCQECDIGDAEFNSKVRYALPGGGRQFLTMHGDLGQIQIALADLIFFGVDIVALNFNMYYSDREYLNEEEEKEYFTRMEAFFHHDPFANFNFTKSIYQAGGFQTDEMGQRIMELNVEEYAKGLEEMNCRKYIRSKGYEAG